MVLSFLHRKIKEKTNETLVLHTAWAHALILKLLLLQVKNHIILAIRSAHPKSATNIVFKCVKIPNKTLCQN